ncbi:MAG TPA: polysaccharide deacetylase family protein [Luteitalea sp.]|nr:polysaccharide deacetylase family protein [Luteitalea sp.]
MSLRETAKQVAASALRRSGVTAAGRARRRDSAVILTYHGVLAAGRPHDEYLSRNCVDQAAFQAQMSYLAQHYTCLPLSELADRLAAGTLPPRVAAVTFDDGFRNNYQYALPVLQATGVPATVFVTTGHMDRGCLMLWTERVAWLLHVAPTTLDAVPVGRARVGVDLTSSAGRRESSRRLLKVLKATPTDERDVAVEQLAARVQGSVDVEPDADRYAFLTWGEARMMAATGLVDIGSHTVTHLLLSTGTPERRRRELADSKLAIEREIGRPCRLFAYPNGTRADFDDSDQRVLRDLGYTAAVSQVPGVNAVDAEPFALRRYNVGLGHSLDTLAAMLAGVWPMGRA